MAFVDPPTGAAHTRVDRDPDITLATVFRSEYGRLVKVAALMCDSQAVAEEIVQDAFVNLHRRWGAVSNPAAYLRTMVVNGARSQLRRRMVERRHRESTRNVADLGADEMYDALQGLPGRQRAALVLRYYADFSEDDIADALRCRPATVRSLIHRGLAKLREVVEQ
jgi:RNA polymerase sigma factor (sigma-70 family)